MTSQRSLPRTVAPLHLFTRSARWLWSFDDDKPTQFATDSGRTPLHRFSLVGALTMTVCHGQRSLPRTVAPLHRSAWLEL